MIERHEGHFKGHDNSELFYQTWSAAPSDSKAVRTLVITHGISEHSEAYSRTAESFANLGWNICAWDLRGHGRSQGKRGYVDKFKSYSLDLGCLLRKLAANGGLQLGNFALFGHSMGGLITIRHLIETEFDVPKPTVVGLSAPALGFSIAVPKVKDVAARVLSRFMPSVTLYNEIKYSELTHDTALLKTYESDPLRHDKISPEVYLGMIESFAIAMSGAPGLKLPTLVQAAGQDRIVSPAGIEEFFGRLGSPDKKLITYPDSYHEIFNDLQKAQAVTDLNAYLSTYLPTVSGEARARAMKGEA